MKRKMPYDQGLILIVLALLGFGLVMVFSASSVISMEFYQSTTAIFTRQLIAVALGLGMLMAVMRIDYHLYGRRIVLILLTVFTLGLLAAALLNSGTSEASRWIRIGPANFQPSELAKLVVVFLTAFFLTRRQGRVETVDRTMLPFLAVLGALILLVFVEPDLGTSLCLLLIAGFLIFLGGLRLRYFLGALLISLPAFYFLVLSVPYRRNRILAFLDPNQDPYGIGYQIRQSLIAVGSGGPAGLGFAQSKQKLFFLPEPHTDFIFAVIGEELGLWGCTLLLALFVLFFWRGVRIALRADSLFGTYVGLGIVAMITFQALINISVVLSVFPTKGIPLPFISVGGSSLLVMLASVGILLNISRHTNAAAIAPAARFDGHAPLNVPEQEEA